MRSWSSTSSVSGGIGCPGQPSISVAPAAWQRTNAMRRRAVDEPERHARVHRMDERALPLDEEELRRRAARPRRRATRPRRRGSRRRPRRRRSPSPRSRSRSGPSARTPTSSPRRRASRSSSTATVFFPIAQSEPTVRTIVASTSRFAPVGTLRPAGGLRRSRSSTPLRSRELGELGIVGDELVQAALDVEPGRDARLQEVAPGRREAAALRRDADDGDGRLEREARRRRFRRSGSPRAPRRRAASRGSRRPGRARSG